MPAPLGPDEEPRAAPAEDFFARVGRHARTCGVTRLADLTGLDRLGLPVWQAVRPAGKALSVHQGKAATPLAARIGALCEAIESHCAENAPADGPLCGFEELTAKQRAPELADYARRRTGVPPADEPIRWCRAEDALACTPFFLPHELVSLDFTARGRSWCDRSSTGLGLGATADQAMDVAIAELIERDAVGEWQRQPPEQRLMRMIDPATVPYGWFAEWRARLTAAAVDLALFAPESLAGMPVLVCWIGGREAFGERYRRFAGSAAHRDPERALFKALAEALQSRLTMIAAARDDILPSTYRRPDAPLPQLHAGAAGWEAVEPGPTGWRQAAARLAAAGYGPAAVKRLDGELDGVAVAKMFVAGLGSLTRARRQ
ncbi:MAG: YcaO-like family protein [Pseudomonadota bacterium]|nr:YcaO-like family protein [Pseudomonadota bacterium]